MKSSYYQQVKAPLCFDMKKDQRCELCSSAFTGRKHNTSGNPLFAQWCENPIGVKPSCCVRVRKRNTQCNWDQDMLCPVVCCEMLPSLPAVWDWKIQITWQIPMSARVCPRKRSACAPRSINVLWDRYGNIYGSTFYNGLGRETESMRAKDQGIFFSFSTSFNFLLCGFFFFF